jgi:NADH:ubiquinone oxidoreductase subunit
MALRQISRLATQRGSSLPCRNFAATYYGNDGMKNYTLIEAPSEGTPSVPASESPFLGSNLILQWMEGVKRYGWQRCFVQAYTMGILKFGTCVGEDSNGNRYYENLDYPHGQHRWVEYKDIHNYDASMIPPEWHGWHTHMHDAPGPSVASFLEEQLNASEYVTSDSADSSKVYHDHVGLNASGYETETMMNKTSFRARGYKIGGLYQKPGDPDEFHVHAGHALNKKSDTRYKEVKGTNLWNPNDSEPDLSSSISSKKLDF